MKGALPDFGAIIVTVDTKDGVPVSARTRSTRGPMVSKLLEGRQADESIPSLISMLYTLCPVAQSTAWRAARAYAEGAPSAEELENWAAGVQLEAMIEHLRCLAFELPRSLDIESRSDAKLIGRLRTRVTGVSRLSKKELEALRKTARTNCSIRQKMFRHSAAGVRRIRWKPGSTQGVPFSVRSSPICSVFPASSAEAAFRRSAPQALL